MADTPESIALRLAAFVEKTELRTGHLRGNQTEVGVSPIHTEHVLVQCLRRLGDTERDAFEAALGKMEGMLPDPPAPKG